MILTKVKNYSVTCSYWIKIKYKLNTIHPFEMIGEEDMLCDGQNRQFTVRCISIIGELLFVNVKNF